jgi:hypothetical protein
VVSLYTWVRGLVVRVLSSALINSGSIPAKMSRFGLSPGVSFFIRKSSIGFDLGQIRGHQRMRVEEWILFAKDVLKLGMKDIKSVQVHPVGPFAFIEFVDIEKMMDTYDPIKEGVFWPHKGEIFPFLCTDSYTEVKLKGLEPGSPPEAVASFMTEFGEVLSCKEYLAKVQDQTGDGFPTGDYLLRMKISSKIPRYIPTANEGNVWFATYEGQEDECWRCWEPGHERRECKSRPYAPKFIEEQKRHRSIFLSGRVSEEEMETPQDTTQVINQGGEAGSNIGGEVFPPGQVASQGSGGAVDEVTESTSVEKEDSQNNKPLDSLINALDDSTPVMDDDEGDMFESGNTQELCDALDNSTKVMDDDEDMFEPGHTQELCDALDKSESGPSGLCNANKTAEKEKNTHERSWSEGGGSPKRLNLIEKKLGDEIDKRKGHNKKDKSVPVLLPADRMKMQLAIRKK